MQRPRKGFVRRYLRRRQTGRQKTNKVINRKAINTMRALRGANVGAGFPAKLTMTHRYIERARLQNIVPAAIEQGQYSVNSLYDPNSSGAGHQPMYFDQMTPIYDQYTVILSKATFTFTNTGTIPVYAGVFLNDDTATTSTTYVGVCEQTNAKHFILGARDSGKATRTITLWWGVKKWFGKSPLANDNLRGTSSSSPAEQMYFNYWTQPIDGTTSADVWVDCQIVYTAVWTELKDIATS